MTRQKSFIVLALVGLALCIGLSPLSAQRRRGYGGGLTLPDDGDVNDALRDLGIDVAHIERMTELTKDQRETIRDIVNQSQVEARRRLLDTLDGPARNLLATYFENAPEFGPELGFVRMTEKQKLEIRQLIDRFKEQNPQGDGRNRYSRKRYQAERELLSQIKEVLDPEQVDTLENAFKARNRAWVTRAANRNRGGNEPRVNRRRDTKYVSLTRIVEIDPEKGLLVGKTSASNTHVFVDEDTRVYVDGAEAKLEDLENDKPLFLYFDEATGRKADVLVQQTDGTAVGAITGKVTANDTGVLTLEGSPIETLTPGLDTYVRNASQAIAAGDIAVGSTVHAIGAMTAEGFKPVLVLDRGQTNATYRLTSGTMLRFTKREGRSAYAYVTIAGSEGETMTFVAGEGFEIREYTRRNRETIDLAELKKRFENDKNRLYVYYEPAKDGEILTMTRAYITGGTPRGR